MSKRKNQNVAASVRAHLLKLAKEKNESFDSILIRYGLERLLYRLSQSEYKNQFILKGAMLFSLWNNDPHRPTRDVDFLAYGDNTADALKNIFKNICEVSVEDDGILFDLNNIKADIIKEEQEYSGIRIQLSAELDSARIPIQADIGFGDVVTPESQEIEYLTLLDQAAPKLRAYPKETVIAEKYQALVNLGIANSRMKDFYDLYVMANEYDFDGNDLSSAIMNTFKQRKTSLPLETPLALTSEFFEDTQKMKQWDAFIRKSSINYTSPTLSEICKFLEIFIMPITSACTEKSPYNKTWTNKGPWK